MHSFIPTLVLALASLAAAQNPTAGFDVITSPRDQETYKVGEAIAIIWEDSVKSGNITLTLIGGPSANNLAPITVIDSTCLKHFSFPIKANQQLK